MDTKVNTLSASTRNIALVSPAMLIFSCIPWFLNHRQAITYSPYNYLLAELFVLALILSVSKPDRNKFLLSPSVIAVSYININFLIGSIVFPKGYVYDFVLAPYRQWEHVNLTLLYFNLVHFVIVHAYFFSRKIRFPKLVIFDFRQVPSRISIVLGVFLILIFSFVGFDLSFFSSSPGDFYIIPKSLGAILIFVVLFRRFNLKVRIFLYACIVMLFAVASFQDKRDAIFLLLPILLLESTRYPFSLRFSRVLMVSMAVCFLAYLIVVMSILRGYGSYRTDGFFSASGYVDDYVKSESFIPSFMNNIEVAYTYFHSNNGVEKIIADPSRLSYGSTLVKPIFIFIPREYFSKKPNSIIELYTKSFSAGMRNMGYSAPISFQSELFWNFHFFGLIMAFPFFLFFNSVYLSFVSLIEEDKIINCIPALYIYQQSLVMLRGSGLDQYAVDIILSFFIFWVLQVVMRVLFPRKSIVGVKGA